MSTEEGTEKFKRSYVCDQCDSKVTLYVKPSSPPMHTCKARRNQPTEYRESQ